VTMMSPQMGKPDASLKFRASFGFTVANGNTSVVQGLTPQAIACLVDVCKAFKYYRFRELSLSIDPVVRFETTVPSTSACGNWAVAYVPDLITATSTTLTLGQVKSIKDSKGGMAQVVNVTVAPGSLLSAGDTVQRVLRIRRKVLREGAQLAYFCQGTPGAGVTQGEFIFAVGDAAGANTVFASGLIQGTIDFWEFEQASTLGVIPLVPARGIPLRLQGSRPLRVVQSEEKDDSDALSCAFGDSEASVLPIAEVRLSILEDMHDLMRKVDLLSQQGNL